MEAVMLCPDMKADMMIDQPRYGKRTTASGMQLTIGREKPKDDRSLANVSL